MDSARQGKCELVRVAKSEKEVVLAAVQEEVLRESKEKIQSARKRLSRPLRENLSLAVSEWCKNTCEVRGMLTLHPRPAMLGGNGGQGPAEMPGAG
jgi:hypothetical protein